MVSQCGPSPSVDIAGECRAEYYPATGSDAERKRGAAVHRKWRRGRDRYDPSWM